MTLFFLVIAWVKCCCCCEPKLLPKRCGVQMAACGLHYVKERRWGLVHQINLCPVGSDFCPTPSTFCPTLSVTARLWRQQVQQLQRELIDGDFNEGRALREAFLQSLSSSITQAGALGPMKMCKNHHSECKSTLTHYIRSIKSVSCQCLREFCPTHYPTHYHTLSKS